MILIFILVLLLIGMVSIEKLLRKLVNQNKQILKHLEEVKSSDSRK
ncbi:hypothetical protein N783_18310 [Pontibacillus marinus BH030004 = DSM 16465]|uniref:Uncharacterized protein n=1 Tax=Pontibacillus marinus BH030004 = DSM 16465 TaxID=1385511 RepID=A0A0A5GFN0_9BACI|nr:hypothetical protein N783_18310 [Pontibacillus marinus BH030004 = DSM 16465]